MPYVVTSECIQCGACVAGCESEAIEEGETQAHIDASLCIECGTCSSNCPVEAIIFVDEAAEADVPALQQEDELSETGCAGDDW